MNMQVTSDDKMAAIGCENLKHRREFVVESRGEKQGLQMISINGQCAVAYENQSAAKVFVNVR